VGEHATEGHDRITRRERRESGREAELSIPRPAVAGAARVMITREPRGGSEQPTTAPLMRVELG
jgi:hypothetical protein